MERFDGYRQTENVQAGRQVRFTCLQEIDEVEACLKAYIQEAIEIEKSGQKVAFKKVTDYAAPEEFLAKLTGNETLKSAFDNLTPGRQKGYLFYFSSAKQAKTRLSRIEKCIPMILAGKGLED